MRGHSITQKRLSCIKISTQGRPRRAAPTEESYLGRGHPCVEPFIRSDCRARLTSSRSWFARSDRSRLRFRLRPDTRLAAWLFTVARHVHLSYVRSRLLEDSVVAGPMALWPFVGERASPFEAAAASELQRRIERALAAMPLASREALLLVAVAGLDQSDAAAVCGVSPEAFRQRLSRARASLARALADTPAGARVLTEVTP